MLSAFIAQLANSESSLLNLTSYLFVSASVSVFEFVLTEVPVWESVLVFDSVFTEAFFELSFSITGISLFFYFVFGKLQIQLLEQSTKNLLVVIV
ncbi:hypothetical protein KQ874_00865 [Mycoplasma sp. ES3157-GEN-MYC]|uniref:Uncharacterized protein n=1 Tax=Mycoplasma miroungigenitalium TaxID=754515 RepID=A0A6M4JB80_9MOLU|nr:hypothetical protein [Mycoplasma miroungigenitalium]MBU4690247.1 hypothetical protein [Mycoplasma miroungigenitalium]MBU4691514.1 hypothetical protein [Mycoplasma miroungigenitalium]QJR43347.1 hypothetical protein HLA87_00855 [Mycoplasma miroungigenitalium]